MSVPPIPYVPPGTNTSILPPLTLAYSNSGQIAATGSVTFIVKNDRWRDIDGIAGFGISIPKAFTLDALSIGSFSGALAGLSCAGGLTVDTTSAPDSNILICPSSSTIQFLSGAVGSVQVQGIANPSDPGRFSFSFDMFVPSSATNSAVFA